MKVKAEVTPSQATIEASVDIDGRKIYATVSNQPDSGNFSIQGVEQLVEILVAQALRKDIHK